MPTYRNTTNAPIICHSVEEVEEMAARHHAQLMIAEDDVGLVNMTVDASKSGRWICMLCKNVSNETLRDVVAQVWLKGTWLHHPDFRAWFVDANFQPPPKEELLHGFGAPRIEKREPNRFGLTGEEGNERDNAPSSQLPYLLVRSAVYLQYSDNFEDEFRIRDLVTAVSGLELYRTEEARVHLPLMKPQDVVDLFRLATREDVMVALAGLGEVDEKGRAYMVGARDRDGRSPLDVAIEKDFKVAAVLLRNLNCKSETFKFERLLDPNFQPMLKELIDPWKQFPFDPVQSLQKVALSGQASILRKLFHCRVDVDFGFEEYPLAEACESGCDDVAWMVLDRMGATGVNPLQDQHCAAFHLVRSLMYSYDHPGVKGSRKHSGLPSGSGGTTDLLAQVKDPNVPTRELTSFSGMEPMSDTARWVAHRLADVCLADGRRFGIPLPALCRAEKDKELMPKLLQLIDITKEKNTEGLLEFFIFFDPQNELSRQLTKKALTDIGDEGVDVEDRVYKLTWQMIRQGERALPMTHWAIELVAFRQYFPFTFRGHNGETILMKALLNKPPNVGALESLLTTIPRSVKGKAMDQPDLNGNNPLKRLVVELTQAPDAYADYMVALGDAVRLMLDHGMEYRVEPPAFSSDLFTMCAREDLGDICYELIPCRAIKGSLILACSMNALALLWRRHRRLQRFPPVQRVFRTVFDNEEAKFLSKHNTKDQGTNTDELTTTTAANDGGDSVSASAAASGSVDGGEVPYITHVVDSSKPASALLTDEERKPFERFTVALPPPSAAPVTTLDARVEAARKPHPTFGPGFLTHVDLEILAHIFTFVKVRDLRLASRVCTSFLYASLFDGVWIDRQVSELYPKAARHLRSLKQHAAEIAEDRNNTKICTPPAIDFIYGSHPLESSRSIYIMHCSEHWKK